MNHNPQSNNNTIWLIPILITIVLGFIFSQQTEPLNIPDARRILAAADVKTPQPAVIVKVQKLLNTKPNQALEAEIKNYNKIQNIIILALISIWMGLFGGIVNFNIEQAYSTKDKTANFSPSLQTCLITGLAASFFSGFSEVPMSENTTYRGDLRQVHSPLN